MIDLRRRSKRRRRQESGMGIEGFKQFEEAEERSDDSCPQPGCDTDGYPNTKQFNAAVAEASALIDPETVDEDSKPLEDKDSQET
jgi:hypothetical protein